jgi:DNA repair protein RadD
MDLRPYQQRAILDVRDLYRQGKRAIVLVLPTGSGKTRIGGELVKNHIAKGGKVVWLAHRVELVDQAAQALEALGLDVGTVAASSRRTPRPAAPVQVSSIQTLIARDEAPEATLAVYDECHHAVAPEYLTLFQRYAGAVRIGLTATPERADGKGLGEAFDALAVGATISELTALGFLVPCNVEAPARALKSGQIAQRPVDAYLEFAVGRRTLVYSPHIKAAEEHLAELRAEGVNAQIITGDTHASDRALLLAQHKAGAFPVLVNCQVLTEGYDDPGVSCAILARGCGSAGLFLQIVGRILRPAPGKVDALLLDLRGSVHVHGEPADERVFSLDGRAIRLAEKNVEGQLCAICGTPIDAGSVCEECGHGPEELEAPTVVHVPLERYAAKKREGEGARAATLARWILVGRSKGFKPGWALMKYKAVYGTWPPDAIRAAAHGLVS